MTDAIIVINSGSTSLKFGAYAVSDADSPPLLCRGEVDGMEDDPRFAVSNASGKQCDTHAWGKDRAIHHKTALQFVICGFRYTCQPAVKMFTKQPASVAGTKRLSDLSDCFTFSASIFGTSATSAGFSALLITSGTRAATAESARESRNCSFDPLAETGSVTNHSL